MAKEKFEDVMKRLESIVNTLERDEVGLDESIKLFEEGLSLTTKLNKQLTTYENKIDELMNNKESQDE